MLVCVPNISVGREPAAAGRVVARLRQSAPPGVEVLDVHADPDHNRTVLTLCGPGDGLTAAMEHLLDALIDWCPLPEHQGLHPRVGALDVVPFVPAAGDDLGEAISAARGCAVRLASHHGLPVFTYAALASGDRARLVTYRRAVRRMDAALADDLPPDHGPRRTHPRAGAVCVGARLPMVAYNVHLIGPIEGARAIAASIRGANGGLDGVEALAFELSAPGRVQVSCNLRKPHVHGPTHIFAEVARQAPQHGLEVDRGEVVGLPPAATVAGPPGAYGLVRPPRALEDALPSWASVG